MEQAKQVFLFNIRQKAVQHTIAVKQGDTAFTLYAAFSDGDNPVYPITQGCTVCFRGVTPQGNEVFNECEKIGDNQIAYTLSPNITSVVGEMECEFVIYGMENRQITAQKFILQVEKTAGQEEEITQTAEFSALIRAMSEVLQTQAQGKELEEQYKILQTQTQGLAEQCRVMLETPPPKGEKGDPGPRGLQGERGPQGETGVGVVGAEIVGDFLNLILSDGSKTGAVKVVPIKGKDYFDGKDGESVTVSKVTESTADGGSNKVTFSDGKTLTVKNGSKGSPGSPGEMGPQGPQGVGISKIKQTKVATQSGDFNIVEVTTSDGKTYAFHVQNGEKGEQGPVGPQGEQGPRGLLGPQGVKGEQGPQGPQGPAGKTPVKGEDYFTPADKAEMVAQVTASLDGIPSYWQSHLSQKVVEIRKAMETAGRNKSAFLWYTDSHWNVNHKKSPALLKYLCNNTPIGKVNFGGDIVQDEPTDSAIDDTVEMEYVYHWRKAIGELPNHHSVVGNHDDGSVVNHRFSDDFVYSFLLAPEETNDMVMGEGFYYYIDNSAEKTRYLYLDTAYKMADEEQIAFVTNALKTTPKGWHVVAISHIWHNAVWTAEKGDYIDGYTEAANTFLQLFYNYNHRVGDFAECEGMVEFCIGGHTHWDSHSYFAEELLVITTETDSFRERVNVTAVEGTITENAVNAVIADYKEKQVSVIRVGRGENQVLPLKNPYVATYTNVIPLSTDKEGNVFNGIGYKPNTRYSNSGGGFVDATGSYCTGFIQVTPNVPNVIRLKNLRMNVNDTASNVCNCLQFNGGKSQTSASNGANMKAYMNAVTDSQGNITEFTVNPNASDATQYIVLNTGYIGADSVITINEPIE